VPRAKAQEEEDGAAPTDNSFFDSNVNGGGNNELSKYFAYGIRNSFWVNRRSANWHFVDDRERA
jgi:hypothetical protein